MQSALPVFGSTFCWRHFHEKADDLLQTAVDFRVLAGTYRIYYVEAGVCAVCADEHQSLSSRELTALTALAEELAWKVANIVELLNSRRADHPAIPVALAAHRHLIELVGTIALPMPAEEANKKVDEPRRLSAAAGMRSDKGN